MGADVKIHAQIGMASDGQQNQHIIHMADVLLNIAALQVALLFIVYSRKVIFYKTYMLDITYITFEIVCQGDFEKFLMLKI
ncbi:MAG: hypothetical protein LBT44_04060 [Clostridiales bacterium]|nr:hypothetical protein [Clostridiales bacterium]